VRSLGGKPLIQYSLQSARAILPTERVLLSTDSPTIASAAEGLARVIERPLELASDATTLDEVAVHAARLLLDEGACESDILLTLQPTSPFVHPRPYCALLPSLKLEHTQ